MPLLVFTYAHLAPFFKRCWFWSLHACCRIEVLRFVFLEHHEDESTMLLYIFRKCSEQFPTPVNWLMETDVVILTSRVYFGC